MATSEELITKLNNDLNSAYSAIEAKGGTVPENKTADNLTDAINSITGGGGGGSEGGGNAPYYAYNVPYFDGGEYGAIAYVNERHQIYYVVAEEASDINLNVNSSSTIYNKNGTRVLSSDVIAYSCGSNIASIPDYAFYKCNNFARFYFHPNNAVTQIGNYFLNQLPIFNQDVSIPDGVTSIGNYFLVSNPIFNAKVTLADSVSSIGHNFMAQNTVYNGDFVFPKGITKLPMCFFRGCSMINQPLIIPEGVTEIETECFENNYFFNNKVVLPSTLTKIGDYFMNSNCSFAQPLEIPASVTKIGHSFMDATYDFVGPLTIHSGTPTPAYPGGSGYLNGLATMWDGAKCYIEGVVLVGDGAKYWKDNMPNVEIGKYQNYGRKLILGE